MEVFKELIKVKMLGYFSTLLLVVSVLFEDNLNFFHYIILIIFALETIGVITNYFNNHESLKYAWKSGEIKSRFEYIKKLFFNY